MAPARVQDQYTDVELAEWLHQGACIFIDGKHRIEVRHDILGQDGVTAEVTDFLKFLLHFFCIAANNANVEI